MFSYESYLYGDIFFLFYVFFGKLYIYIREDKKQNSRKNFYISVSQ